MGHKKFDRQAKGKYITNYFNKDREFYNTIKKHIARAISNKSTLGIDIGAGPGIGAKLLENLNLNTKLIGFEPSKTWEDGKKLSKRLIKEKKATRYIAKKGGIQNIRTPTKNLLDYILILRASHEIAESLGGKRRFFIEVLRIMYGLKESGFLIIGEPQYSRRRISQKIIKKVQQYQEENIGHYHIPSDYITAQEMKTVFEKKGLRLIKETILPNKKLLNYLKSQGLNLKKAPCNFYVQTFQNNIKQNS